MRLLRYVGPGDDGSHVIVETADGGEQFHLLVDVALRDAIRSDLPRLSHVQPESPSSVTPREIQMRVRGGESPQDLAETEGMTLERVLRFAGAVLEERARIADAARRARARRSTTEGQAVVFGEAVDERFAAHGIDPATVRWDTHRREDGQWVLVAHWVGGQTDRTAEWGFHLSGRTVTPLDDTAADLLSDRPIRPIAPPPDPEPTAPSLALAPPLVPGLVAFPAMPDAHTGPLPRAEEVFDLERVEREQAEQGTAELPRIDAPRADDQAEPDYDEPQLPIDVPGAPKAVPPARPRRIGVAGRASESEEDKAARAAIPSWDDILLGVRRKRD